MITNGARNQEETQMRWLFGSEDQIQSPWDGSDCASQPLDSAVSFLTSLGPTLWPTSRYYPSGYVIGICHFWVAKLPLLPPVPTELASCIFWKDQKADNQWKNQPSCVEFSLTSLLFLLDLGAWVGGASLHAQVGGGSIHHQTEKWPTAQKPGGWICQISEMASCSIWRVQQTQMYEAEW